MKNNLLVLERLAYVLLNSLIFFLHFSMKTTFLHSKMVFGPLLRPRNKSNVHRQFLVFISPNLASFSHLTNHSIKLTICYRRGIAKKKYIQLDYHQQEIRKNIFPKYFFLQYFDWMLVVGVVVIVVAPHSFAGDDYDGGGRRLYWCVY
jgi:hypothetical protein